LRSAVLRTASSRLLLRFPLRRPARLVRHLRLLPLADLARQLLNCVMSHRAPPVLHSPAVAILSVTLPVETRIDNPLRAKALCHDLIALLGYSRQWIE
jgi:hypothetical protein